MFERLWQNRLFCAIYRNTFFLFSTHYFREISSALISEEMISSRSWAVDKAHHREWLASWRRITCYTLPCHRRFKLVWHVINRTASNSTRAQGDVNALIRDSLTTYRFVNAREHNKQTNGAKSTHDPYTIKSLSYENVAPKTRHRNLTTERECVTTQIYRVQVFNNN